MNLINNRYRVLDVLYEKYYTSRYLVADAKLGNKRICIDIFNKENLSSEIIDYFNSQFIKLKNANNSGIVNLLEYGNIYSYDNVEKTDTSYYYLSEYIDNPISITDNLDSMTSEQKLDIFAQVCCEINTLYLKGFFCNISELDDIYVTKHQNKLVAKIKDMVSISLDNYEKQIIDMGNGNIKMLMHSVGTILAKIFKGCSGSDTRFVDLAALIIQSDDGSGLNSITELINYININFEKNYKPFYLEELEKLSLKNVMVGRKDLLKHIMEQYQYICENKAGTNVMGIYGDSGAGKTKFLHELIHILRMDRIKVFSDKAELYIGEKQKTNRNFIKELIENVDDGYDGEYAAEINSLMAMFLNSDYGVFDSNNSNVNDVYKFISGIHKIMEKTTDKQPIVIIIDDMDLTHGIYKEIVKYALVKNKINALVIFSYKEHHKNTDNNMKEFLEFLRNYKNYEDIKLQYLNENETALMVKEILSMPKIPTNISNRIYAYTYGNPLFIEEVVKNLLLTKKIYINTSGKWATNYNTMRDIPMPSSLKEAIESQIESISANEVKILKLISAFNVAIRLDILGNIIDIDNQTKCIIDDAVNKGILIETKVDNESQYEFSNKLMRKLIYYKLQGKEKSCLHIKIANELEKEVNNNNYKYMDELIYHLENINDSKKLLKFCVCNAVKLEKKGIYEGSIKYLEKAKRSLVKNSNDQRILSILLKLGDLYRRNGYIQKAQSYYEMCYEYSRNMNNTNMEAMSQIKIATIYFNRNEIDACDEYLNRIERLLEKNYYLIGEIEANIIKIKIYELRQEYLKATEMCNHTIKLCDGKMPRYMGRLLKHLGNINYFTGNINRALENYEESIRWYEKINYLKGTLNPLNSIGVIWGDYYQDDKKALTYFFKMKKISQDNKFLESDILALINIGETYLIENDYEVALKYFSEASEKCEKFSRENDIFYNYIDIACTYLKMEDYKNAFKYYKILRDELLEYPEQGLSLNLFYKFLSEMFLAMGSIDRAKYFSSVAVRKYGEDNSINKWNARIIKDIVQIADNRSEELIDSAINDIDRILNNLKSRTRKSEIVYRTAYMLYIKGYNRKSGELLEKYKPNTQETKIVALKKYLQAVLCENENKLEYLTEALEVCEKYKDKELQWRVCCQIGNLNNKMGNYFYAINYYFQSIQIIKELLFSVDDKFKIDYYNNNGMHEPVYKIYLISVNIEKNTTSKIEAGGVKSLDELDHIFKYENTKNLLANRKLIRSAREIFDIKNNNNIKNFKELISSLKIDPVYNLGIIAKYIARSILAKQAYIIIEGYKKELKVVFALNDNDDEADRKNIIEIVRKTKRELLITDEMLAENENIVDDSNAYNKVVMCIPIITDINLASSKHNNERRNRSNSNKLVRNIGYVYFQADRLINNFNSTALSRCNQLIPLIGLNIDKYVLKANSSIDKLTRTFNRKYLEDTLEEQKYLCDSNKTIFSIVMLDLDNFKHINDKYGHQAGDEVLSSVCSTILNSIRESDCCGRYGGEEFIIVLPQTDLQKTLIVAEKIRNKVARTKMLNDNHKVTVSIGISSYPSQAHTIKELVEKADQALYVAKKMGRNRSQIWEDSFKGKVKTSSRLTGIITGNVTQDYRNVSVLIEIADLIRKEDNLENKIYILLGRIIEVTEAEYGSFIIIKDNNVEKMYSRRMFKDGWQESEDNTFIIQEVIKSGDGKYMIDWDTTYDRGIKNEMPDWKSIIISPIINNGVIEALIVLSAHTRNREFDFQDYNFVRALGQVAEGLLK